MISIAAKLRERNSLLTVKEVAELLGQTKDMAYLFLRKQPRLKIRVGGRLRVDPIQFADYLENSYAEVIAQVVDEL